MLGLRLSIFLIRSLAAMSRPRRIFSSNISARIFRLVLIAILICCRGD